MTPMEPEQPEERLWTPRRWRSLADAKGVGAVSQRGADRTAAVQTQTVDPEDSAAGHSHTDARAAGYQPPRVRLREVVRRSSRTRWLVALGGALVIMVALGLIGSGVEALRAVLQHNPAPKSLLLSPSAAAADAQTPTYDALFPGASWPGWLALLVWLAVVELLGLVTFPLAFVAFPGLRDRGLGLSKLLGLLLLGYLVWLPASLRLLPFDRWVVVLALLVLVAAGAAVGWWRRTAVWALLRVRWRVLLAGEVLFLCAFAYLAWIRALDPNLFNLPYSGEKPFELAFINGILRSRSFPPLDPWFAGSYINYYYYGQYLVAVLIRLTGIAPPTAFNLALPLLFAMSFSSVFSIVVSIARRWWIGLAGGVAVLLLGNLQSGLQLTHQLGALLRGQPAPAFNYTAPGHVIPFTTNEFPYWSYLFGDLHAHVIDLSIELLVIALAVSLLVSARPTGAAAWFRAMPTLAALALALGTVWCTNTWDVPTYMALAAVALALRLLPLGAESGWRTIARRALQWRAIAGYLVAIGVTLAAAYVLFWPFHQTYYNISQGIGLNQYFSPPGDFALLFGLWLFVAISFFAVELRERLRAVLARRLEERAGMAPWLAAGGVVLALALFGVSITRMRGVTNGLALLLLWGGVLAANPRQSRAKLVTYLLLLFGIAIPLGVELVFIRAGSLGSPAERANTVFKFYEQTWLFLALGATLAAVDLAGRLRLAMWRVGARVGARARAHAAAAPRDPSAVGSRAAAIWLRRATVPALQIGWLVTLCLMVVAALSFTVEGTASRVADPAIWAAIQPPPAGVQPQGLSLDGAAFMRGWYPDDYAAITWLQGHVTGIPTIVEEASGPVYVWSGRVSAYTGFPDIANWGHHEAQERTPEEVERRQADVGAFYDTPDPQAALAFLHAYHVRYVYLGELERACPYHDPYGPCRPMSAAALGKFTQLEQMGVLRAVYHNASVVIYEVVG